MCMMLNINIDSYIKKSQLCYIFGLCGNGAYIITHMYVNLRKGKVLRTQILHGENKYSHAILHIDILLEIIGLSSVHLY